MIVTIAAVTAPSHLNGVSRHAINLARALLLVPGVHKIHFLIGAWQSEMLQEAAQQSDPRLQVHLVSATKSSFGLAAWYYRDLPLIAEQLQSDVVHLAHPAPLRARAFRSPVIVTLHDLYPFQIPKNWGALKGWLSRQALRHTLRHADAIACVSNTTRLALKRFLPAYSAKATTINNSVAPLAGANPVRPAAMSTAPFVLCIAQHRANKNIPLALRIFQTSLRHCMLPRTTRMVIVGIAGPETPSIWQRIAHLDLQGKVLLMSGLPDAELQWCYQNCIALIAPSITEGFGLPVAEALLAGCHVIGSDIPAFREIAGDAALLISFGDGVIDAYCMALRDAYHAPRPQPLALPHLSPQSIGNQYVELYKKILAHRNPEFAILPQPALDNTLVESNSHPPHGA